MKCLITILIGFYCCVIYSQEYIPNYNEIKPKKGIYKTFDEFKNNSPSILNEYRLVVRTPYEQAKLLAKGNILKIIDATGNERRIRKIWGFFDGDAIFIYYPDSFNKLINNGRYRYFIHYFYYENFSATMVLTPYYMNSTEYVLDSETGEIYTTKKKNLKLILSKNEVLFREFLKDKNWRYKKLEYIERLNKNLE